MGTVNSFKYGMLMHGAAAIFLGSSPSVAGVFAGMPFLAAGASAMPVLLGYLTEQVPRAQVGALQAAAETVRMVAGIIGNPLFAQAFARCISTAGGRQPFPQGALYLTSVFSLAAFALLATIRIF